MSRDQRKEATRAISRSARDDFRSYMNNLISDIEQADRNGNTREVTRLTKIISGKKASSSKMPSKDLAGDPILSAEQLISAWHTFLTDKFKSPPSDANRYQEHTVSPEDRLLPEELEKALKSLNSGKAPGADGIPIEAFKHSATAKEELFRIITMIWDLESPPPELVIGTLIMFYKKKNKDDYANYRAICLLNHAYKLLSAVIARRLQAALEPLLPDSQAGFRPARGTRDNICILKWTINMLLQEEKPAVVTFIDYSAAFDTESQLFLDEALQPANVPIKLRRITQSFFKAATGCVRINKPNGEQATSEAFNISRGVLQGDIFSPVAFIAGLMRTFNLHDLPDSGVLVGKSPHQLLVSSLEYADDAALLDQDAASSSKRISSISKGSREDAAMDISIPKTKTMHIHHRVRVSKTTTEEIAEMDFKPACPVCTRAFPKQSSVNRHKRWCLGDPAEAETRSRVGTLADKAVKKSKRVEHEKTLEKVAVEGQEIDNIYTFEYLGSRVQSDGEITSDVKFRMDIAQATFSSLHHVWKDHRLHLPMKIRLYRSAVCHSLNHGCEAWDLVDRVAKMLNGFNSRCLHTITNKTYRETATNPDYDLVLSIRRRRMRYAGHVLRMDENRLVRRSLMAYINGGHNIPDGSLIMDCDPIPIDDLTAAAEDRASWNRRVSSLG